MTRAACALPAVLAVVLHAVALGAADPPQKKEPTFSDRFPGLEFRCIGPYRGGRSTAVTGVRREPTTFYFGGTGGGVWKTTDGGGSWEPVSDKDFKTGSVGAIAVSESDPNVVYAGMGESPIRGNHSHGDGVWKSTDAGATWKNVGLHDARQISRVRIHPQDPNVVYVAAQGHSWGPNDERGIYRTVDGGATWKRVLYVDDKTGASDLSMDPRNPRVLYAAFWQVVRKPWELVSGGPGGGFWKTTDGGDTWTKLAEGLPEEPLGRCGIAASGAKPGRVWAILEAKDRGGLYLSDDGGEKWKQVNDDHKIRERAWYYSWVYPDPKNENTVYLPNVEMHLSIDGGATFSSLRVPHGDNHDMWIDPDEPQRFILGNDGGATITVNGGKSWSTQDNQATAQFYRVATDDRFPYWVYGSQQDNSSVAIPSGVPGTVIDFTDWHSVGGGESGWIAPNPVTPEVVYAGEYGGVVTRYDDRTKETRVIMSWPQLADGRAGTDLKYRFQWNAPILVSPNDPKVLYHAAQVLMRSRDDGETWEAISPDLTRNDAAKQGRSGGPITKDITGVELYDTIFALAESRLEKGVIWAGSDDGLIHVTRDDGKSWQDVTPRSGWPDWIQVNAIDPSPHDKATAYVAATMYKLDDFKPYLFKTTDYGKSWTKITSGIPDGAFTRVIREDPVRRGLLYAGTETGLYVSLDDGAHWRPFQRNLPAVPITDMAVKNGDLVVATQGRSFWILDDLTPLRLWDDRIVEADAKLFPPRPTPRFLTETPREDDDGPRSAGKNMPGGVVIDFWLKEKPKPKEPVTLEILSGPDVIRTLTSEKKEGEGALKERAEREAARGDRDKPLSLKEGVNRVVWDMRILRPTLVPKAVFNEGEKAPPRVAPGTYRVRLTVAGKPQTESFEVRPNPTSPATAADLRAQFDLLEGIRNAVTTSHVSVMKIRDARAQVLEIGERAARLGKGEDLRKKAAGLAQALTALELKLTNPEIKADEDDLNFEPKLDHDFTYLAGIVASADRRPTASSVEMYRQLKGRLDAEVASLDALLAGDVVEFSRASEAAGLPRVVVAPKLTVD